MQKIPTIFERDWEGDKSLVTDKPNPACDWVFCGEGVATRKWDGTACMVRGGVLYKRYDARVQPRPRFNQETKKVREKQPSAPPENFLPADEPDYETGHWPGWVPVGDKPEDKWHQAGLNHTPEPLEDGTYELIGPGVQGNAEAWPETFLVRHGCVKIEGAPTAFDALKSFFEHCSMEGIVWHNPDGRMAKIKSRDFGIAWPRKAVTP